MFKIYFFLHSKNKIIINTITKTIVINNKCRIEFLLLVILVLLLLIILFNQNEENFTGFRKFGFLTEIENNPSLFPYLYSWKQRPDRAGSGERWKKVL